MIGRRHHLVVDTADPQALAAFWSELLGDPNTFDDGDFVVAAAGETTSGMALQRSPDHRSPRWPDASIPQQMHIDVMVDDLVAAHREGIHLGAQHRDGNALADPAGHPFCLNRRPSWAPPIHPTTRQ